MKQNKQDNTHTRPPARARTHAPGQLALWKTSYYRCGPLISAYIDKN